MEILGLILSWLMFVSTIFICGAIIAFVLFSLIFGAIVIFDSRKVRKGR